MKKEKTLFEVLQYQSVPEIVDSEAVTAIKQALKKYKYDEEVWKGAMCFIMGYIAGQRAERRKEADKD